MLLHTTGGNHPPPISTAKQTLPSTSTDPTPQTQGVVAVLLFLTTFPLLSSVTLMCGLPPLAMLVCVVVAAGGFRARSNSIVRSVSPGSRPTSTMPWVGGWFGGLLFGWWGTGCVFGFGVGEGVRVEVEINGGIRGSHSMHD